MILPVPKSQTQSEWVMSMHIWKRSLAVLIIVCGVLLPEFVFAQGPPSINRGSRSLEGLASSPGMVAAVSL